MLSRFIKEEGEKLETALSNSAKAAELVVEGKINEAMNLYNRA